MLPNKVSQRQLLPLALVCHDFKICFSVPISGAKQWKTYLIKDHIKYANVWIMHVFLLTLEALKERGQIDPPLLRFFWL